MDNILKLATTKSFNIVWKSYLDRRIMRCYARYIYIYIYIYNARYSCS